MTSRKSCSTDTDFPGQVVYSDFPGKVVRPRMSSRKSCSTDSSFPGKVVRPAVTFQEKLFDLQ
ncbi:hypothetical protein WA026_020004 [Henosepilachna vigintioctopunctata]|uniref:Uncharacterized protein n=1 Tax=Henosepilachna vigintioctopunctata TaxID=420089 RepID=A0AAW1V5B3_9CUCU